MVLGIAGRIMNAAVWSRQSLSRHYQRAIIVKAPAARAQRHQTGTGAARSGSFPTPVPCMRRIGVVPLIDRTVERVFSVPPFSDPSFRAPRTRRTLLLFEKYRDDTVLKAHRHSVDYGAGWSSNASCRCWLGGRSRSSDLEIQVEGNVASLPTVGCYFNPVIDRFAEVNRASCTSA